MPGPCSECAAGRTTPVRVLLQKTATAYVVVRTVRLLQAHGTLPGHGGLRVGGVHVHHFVHGLGLLLLQATARTCLHRPGRANLLGTGAALVVEELDVLSGVQHTRLAAPLRAVLDAAGVLGAAVGLGDARRTWSGWYRA